MAVQTGTRSVSISWFRTTDTKLAAFLWTAGCKPKNPPLRKKYKADNPSDVTIEWVFECEKGSFGKTLDECVGIWKKGVPYIADNPTCPVGQIMGTIKNYAFLVDMVNKDTPFNTIIFYNVNGQRISCVKDSKKHKKLKERLGY
jgi:hypothetical protein